MYSRLAVQGFGASESRGSGVEPLNPKPYTLRFGYLDLEVQVFKDLGLKSLEGSS